MNKIAPSVGSTPTAQPTPSAKEVTPPTPVIEPAVPSEPTAPQPAPIDDAMLNKISDTKSSEAAAALLTGKNPAELLLAYQERAGKVPEVKTKKPGFFKKMLAHVGIGNYFDQYAQHYVEVDKKEKAEAEKAAAEALVKEMEDNAQIMRAGIRQDMQKYLTMADGIVTRLKATDSPEMAQYKTQLEGLSTSLDGELDRFEKILKEGLAGKPMAELASIKNELSETIAANQESLENITGQHPPEIADDDIEEVSITPPPLPELDQTVPEKNPQIELAKQKIATQERKMATRRIVSQLDVKTLTDLKTNLNRLQTEPSAPTEAPVVDITDADIISSSEIDDEVGRTERIIQSARTTPKARELSAAELGTLKAAMQPTPTDQAVQALHLNKEIAKEKNILAEEVAEAQRAKTRPPQNDTPSDDVIAALDDIGLPQQPTATEQAVAALNLDEEIAKEKQLLAEEVAEAKRAATRPAPDTTVSSDLRYALDAIKPPKKAYKIGAEELGPSAFGIPEALKKQYEQPPAEVVPVKAAQPPAPEKTLPGEIVL